MNNAWRQPPARMTLPDFQDWDSGDQSGAQWQLVDGEPVAMAPASRSHGTIQATLARLLGNHLESTGSASSVVVTPGIIPRVRANENFRIPDLCVTSAPVSLGLEVSDPILLIEIMSPRNEPETRANIWAYTTIPSVQEILIIQSTRIGAELLRRSADGWPDAPIVIEKGARLDLESIGYSVMLAELYAKTTLQT